jgi:hypothetical protein
MVELVQIIFISRLVVCGTKSEMEKFFEGKTSNFKKGDEDKLISGEEVLLDGKKYKDLTLEQMSAFLDQCYCARRKPDGDPKIPTKPEQYIAPVQKSKTTTTKSQSRTPNSFVTVSKRVSSTPYTTVKQSTTRTTPKTSTFSSFKITTPTRPPSGSLPPRTYLPSF